MREWDPIGVAGAPMARDEYDSYLGRIAERLRRGENLTEFLATIRTKHMGLPQHRAADLRAASALRRWYDSEMGSA
jgi:hypothetical protein